MTRYAFAFALAFLLLSPPAIAQFETRSNFDVTIGANSVAVGDFNRDGKLDVAATSYTSNQVQVFLGNGDGTFSSPTAYDVGLDASPVAAVDLNGDGKLDLVVVSGDDSIVSVLLGNGDGTFQPAMRFATPSDPVDLALGDFNGDGKIDIATADLSNNQSRCDCISVLLGNGDGTFQEPAIVTPLSLGSLALAAGYFDAGSTLDLAVTQEFGIAQVQILLGNGDGTFRVGQAYSVGPSPNSIIAADLNNDHKTDLAVAELGGVGVAIFLGTGDGTFQPAVEYRVTFPDSVRAADVNGDGNVDLVLANDPTVIQGAASVLFGNGDGTLQPALSFPVPKIARFAAVGDFNGDHRFDIAVANNGGLTILLNTGAVSFSPNTPLAFGAQLLGTTSPATTVTLTNTGSATLNISSMTAGKPFGVSSNCGGNIAPGASCNLSVTFSPHSLGAKSGTVSIRDSASSKPQVIEVSGRGTNVALTPNPLNFGPQKVGTKSSPKQIGVTNHGSTSLSVNSITVGGANPKDFSLSGTSNCTSQALAPGATCRVSVTFTPQKTGARSATINVTDNGGGSPESASVTGTGT